LLEVGWGAAAVDDPLLGPVVGPRRAMHWNDDIVTRLPDGAVQLATASTGEVQAARHAETVWGVQWHPEGDDSLIREWATDGTLSPVDEARLLDELVRSRGELDDAWRPLARSFSTLVRTASRVGWSRPDSVVVALAVSQPPSGVRGMWLTHRLGRGGSSGGEPATIR